VISQYTDMLKHVRYFS